MSDTVQGITEHCTHVASSIGGLAAGIGLFAGGLFTVANAYFSSKSKGGNYQEIGGHERENVPYSAM